VTAVRCRISLLLRFVGAALVVALLAVPLAGCGIVEDLLGGDTRDVDYTKELEGENTREENQRSQDEKARASEPDLALKAGDILVVRLRYGGALAEGPAWYKVRIDNPRNGWYDYVEYSSDLGLGGDEMGSNSHDYDFASENFNKQATAEGYDPKDVDGEYTMTISNNAGWSMDRKLSFKAGKFEQGDTFVYDVP
jgi:hypothetical protein